MSETVEERLEALEAAVRREPSTITGGGGLEITLRGVFTEVEALRLRVGQLERAVRKAGIVIEG